MFGEFLAWLLEMLGDTEPDVLDSGVEVSGSGVSDTIGDTELNTTQPQFGARFDVPDAVSNQGNPVVSDHAGGLSDQHTGDTLSKY